MDLREELTTKILVTLKGMHDIDVTETRHKLVMILSDYSVEPMSTALVANDIGDKLKMFLAVKTLEGYSKGTLMNYSREIMNFSRHIFKPVNEVTIMDLRQYIALNHEKLKASTINTKITRLKSFFNWMHDEGYIENNPTRNLDYIKTEKRVRKGLTLEQMELLRACCITKREKALIEFLYSTGCRVSEAVEVKLSDLDWHDMSLYIIGKGNKERKVYFSERAKVILMDYIDSRNDNCPYLFATTRAPSQLGRNSMLKEVKAVGERMYPPIRVYPHLLRHTFATHAVNSGIPIEVVQRLLGHESPATTIIYAQLDETTIKNEYRKL